MTDYADLEKCLREMDTLWSGGDGYVTYGAFEAATLREAADALATVVKERDALLEPLRDIMVRYEFKNDMTEEEGIAWHARARAAIDAVQGLSRARSDSTETEAPAE